MKMLNFLLFVAFVGTAAAQDAVKTVTYGVIEVGSLAAAVCPTGTRSGAVSHEQITPCLSHCRAAPADA
jgi:hypothetical protein